MKAAQTFSILVDEAGEQVAGRGKTLTIRKNEEVPDRYVTDLIQSNPTFLQLEYDDYKVKLSEKEKAAYEAARTIKTVAKRKSKAKKPKKA